MEIIKTKKRINSKQKGKRGELQWRNVLHAEGFNTAYRAQQYCGSNDSADVICPELPTLHFEVKVGNQIPSKLYDFMSQARNDCGDNTPILAVRRDNCEWLVVMASADYFALVKESDAIQAIVCPECKTTNTCKNGKNHKAQKYLCRNDACERVSFDLR